MNLQQVINMAFDKIVNTFPLAMVEYEYMNHSNTHFFKICPEEVYNNEEYLKIEEEVEDSFNSLNSEDDIAFITANSLITLDTPSKVSYPAVSQIKVITENTSFTFINIINSKPVTNSLFTAVNRHYAMAA